MPRETEMPSVESNVVLPLRTINPASPPPSYNFDPPPQNVAPPAYDDLFPPTTTLGSHDLVPAAPIYVEPADVPVQPSAPPESRPATAAAINPALIGLSTPTRPTDSLPPKRSTPPPPATRPGAATSSGATSTTAGSTTASSTSSTTTSTSTATSSSTSTSTRTTTTAARSTTTRTTATTRREYDYSKLDKYYCYCETFRCNPCSPPQEHPKKCELEKDGCTKALIFLTIVFLFCAIFFPVYFTWPPCDHKCANSDDCITTGELCDGITQCKENDDERDCVPEFTSMAKYVVGILGSSAKIECTAVIGSDVIEWFHTDTATGAITIIWNSDGHTLTGYGVDDYKDHYDLEINRLTESHVNLTYGVRFNDAVGRRFANIIVTDDFFCTPSTASTIEEGETINLTATVRYYGDYAPLVLWYTDSDKLLSSVFDISTNGDEHTLIVTYSTEALVSVNGVSFSAYMLERFPRSSYDSPPTTYTQTCHVTYSVLYSPRNIFINYTSNSAEAIIIHEANSIYCYGIGNPEPAYSWSCNSGRFTAEGYTFTVPAGAPTSLTCTCTGTNVINGVTHTGSESVTFDTVQSGFSRSVFSLPLLVMAFFAKYL